MSVVNQMLRDLQESQAEVKQLPLQSSIESSGISRLAISALIVLIVVAFSYAAYRALIAPPQEAPNFNLKPESKTVLDARESTPITTIESQNNAARNKSLALETDKKISAPSKANNKSSLVSDTSIVSDRIFVSDTQLASKLKVASSTKAAVSSSPQVKEITTRKVDEVLSSSEKKSSASIPKISQTKRAVELVKNTAAQTAVPAQKIKSQSRSTLIKKRFETIKNSNMAVGFEKTKLELNRLLQDASNFHPARLFLINLMWQQKDPQTTESITTAIERFPGESAFRLVAARFFIEKNDLASAEEKLIGINENYPSAAQLIQTRAVVRQKLGKHQLAITDYQSLLKLSPPSADVYLALGISFGAVGQTGQAIASFERALRDPRITQRQQQFIRNKLALYQG